MSGLLLFSQTFFLYPLISQLSLCDSPGTAICHGHVFGLRFTCAACRSLAHRVAHVTVAYEGALGVLAVPAQADIWVQFTLIHI